uniref:Uncharacterized protein n=1 Tax=Rhizophora mucronata TaxID=61149 RepID=A0A2P2QJ79_RHIMU
MILYEMYFRVLKTLKQKQKYKVLRIR